MAKHVVTGIANNKKILSYILGVFVILNVSGVTAEFIYNLRQQPAPDMYKGAAEFMRDHSNKGDIIFQQRFDIYPRLVFFNQKNSYIMGMSETFTYAYDPDIFWLWRHIVNSEPVCPRKKCDQAQSLDVYETIKNVFKARYIFIDSRENFGDLQILNTPGFVDLLESDPRFKKVFIDPEYRDIMVFEV